MSEYFATPALPTSQHSEFLHNVFHLSQNKIYQTIHPLIDSLIHSIIQSFTHSLIHPFTHSPIHPFTHSIINHTRTVP